MTERSSSEPGAEKAPAPPPATSPAALVVLTKRADFLAAARARRQAAPAFLLQARRRAEDMSSAQTRIGFTCSKKVGNAVARNRAKRRLREIARLELPRHGKPGWDYVLVGRKEATATRDFAALRADLVTALGRIHAPRNPSGKPPRNKAPRP
ncbi:ribonuclease P protein component [Dinoroseobacter sp. S76]|uniref:ribonuclease P protein component n=1 Tax=Dinoroseobacter sp. S76 TaxID=3415124 RepID=UPI003C7A0E8A